MKLWRVANPDYMKDYYASHPKQLEDHKAMVRDLYWKMKRNPAKYAAYLKRSKEYQRLRYKKRKQLKAFDSAHSTSATKLYSGQHIRD